MSARLMLPGTITSLLGYSLCNPYWPQSDLCETSKYYLISYINRAIAKAMYTPLNLLAPDDD